ncbi:hypothetical protein [Planctomicrobium piriforme]|uniref:Uncharacterized protein n=1 Tax=Planctomicrobium piriforme TaxID=1576369 RepID=A0A1I3CC27_9PLAN|nr:hypothetical protein [Planctomicrobium piriforme]SFH72105.1 hypothetical protein SAMN05421753_102218 [Planctomicrobium piriforme]
MRHVIHSFLGACLASAIIPLLSSFAWTQESPSSPAPATVAKAVAPVPPPPIPVPLRPYNVAVQLAFSPSATVSASVQTHWVDEVQSLLNAWYGQMWSLQVNLDHEWSSPEEFTASATGANSPDWVDASVDKMFRVLIDDQGAGSVALCREWDQCSRSLGQTRSATIHDRRDVPRELAALIAEAFRPLVEIDVIDGGKIEGLVRAGEFPPRIDELTPVRTGDYLVPFFRHLDRKKDVRSIQFLPWTYLKVDQIERARVRTSLVSSFPNPFPASRRRMEVWALRERPTLPTTEIYVSPRGGKQNPLAGVRCEVFNERPTPEQPATDVLKLKTSRLGLITVPASSQHVVRYLQIYSGDALLARVPLIPGLVPRLELEVPDDRARLNVEGEVHLLEGELIDIVATREVLMARIRTAADQDRWPDVDRLMEDLNKLPNLKAFLSRIETLRIQSVYAAQQAKDRVAETRIERLCEKIGDSAKKHLDPVRVNDLKANIASERLKK